MASSAGKRPYVPRTARSFSAPLHDFARNERVYVWRHGQEGWAKCFGRITERPDTDSYTVVFDSMGDVKVEEGTIQSTCIFRSYQKSEPPEPRTVVKREHDNDGEEDTVRAPLGHNSPKRSRVAGKEERPAAGASNDVSAKDEDVEQFPEFSPCELETLGDGSIVWAWLVRCDEVS